MRLAVLIPSFLPKLGGAQIFAHNVSLQLHRLGHVVELYTTAENSTRFGYSFDYRVIGLPPYFFSIIKRLPFAVGLKLSGIYLGKIQKARRYHGWLAVMSYPSGYAVAGLRGSVPIVLRCSGEDIQRNHGLNYGIRLNANLEGRLKKILLSYDRLVALTDSVRDDFRDLGVSDDKVVEIPNGVDISRFKLTSGKLNLKGELGWPLDLPVILTVGRYHQKKGFHFIPMIAKRLLERGFQFKWYVVGRDSKTIEPVIEEYGVGKVALCIDEIGISPENDVGTMPPERLVQMYRAADIFAFPSLLETFGMVLIEAMAAGLAVVSTDAPGCRDVVRPGVNGLQVSAGNVDEFAERIEELLSNKLIRDELGSKAKQFANHFDWEHIAGMYEGLFRKLASERDYVGKN